MSGFGFQGAGTTNAGYGSVPASVADDGIIFRDVLNGGQLSGRSINPKTGDYDLDANGRIVGMTTTRQMVILAIKTVRDSSAVKGLGKEPDPDRIVSNIEAVLLDRYRVALKRVIDLGYVTLIGFSSFKAGDKDGLRAGAVYGRLKWRDNTTGVEQLEFV